MADPTDQGASFKKLIEIGIALSAERQPNRLMERILIEAKAMTGADGGSLYIRTESDTLKFEIIRTESLGLAQGGTTGIPISLPDVPLYGPDKLPNCQNIASHTALTGKTVNIADAYDSRDFDFSGTRRFDESTGYRSRSLLSVPLKNHQDRVIGVLQLLNAQDAQTGAVVTFAPDLEPLVEALASQAAVALENQILLQEQKHLLESFIELMASAVDAKSPYTGGHCQRVPVLTKMLARAACASQDQPFRDFDLDDDQWYELHIGAWLHDCGKVTTPEYVVDKATKLETITDRIHEIRTRFEVVKREAVIDYHERCAEAGSDPAALKAELQRRLVQLDEDFAFVAECNIGGEFMSDEQVERLRRIAAIQWTRTLSDRIGISQLEMDRKQQIPEAPLPCREYLLADRPDHLIEHDVENPSADPNNPYGFRLHPPPYKYNRGELYNLCVRRGTLTDEERFKINDHIVQTIVMLNQLPFPKYLQGVPEIAGGHHEKMDGTGYPRRLRGEEMSIPARIMAIADVFEALTAADRPYKHAKTLSESIRLMGMMVRDSHLDPEIFKLFLKSGVYLDYAQTYLLPEQIDDVDLSVYL